MNRTKLLELLNKWGVHVPADATDQEIVNLVEAGPPPAGEDITSPETASRIRNVLSRIISLLDEKIPANDPDIQNKANMKRIEIGCELRELQTELNEMW